MTDPSEATGERALIERAVGGDRDAVAALVVAHRPAVVRAARHLLGDPTGAEDIAQDVLVRMQAALPGFRGDAALATWLYRVTLNLCRDHLRRVKRRGVHVDLADAGDTPALSVAARADRRVDGARLRGAVRDAIDRLPDDQREVIILRYLEELSYPEIARLTDTPQGTVASRVFRALERLGRELGPRRLEVVE